jgi:hypothetical protein
VKDPAFRIHRDDPLPVGTEDDPSDCFPRHALHDLSCRPAAGLPKLQGILLVPGRLRLIKGQRLQCGRKQFTVKRNSGGFDAARTDIKRENKFFHGFIIDQNR